MKSLRYSFCFLLIVSLISCVNSNTQFITEYFKTNPELYKKKIHMEYFPILPYNKINYPIENSDKRIKVINIISFGCNPCVEKMINWKKFLRNSKKSNKLDVIFFAIGDSTEYFNYEIKKNNFPFPIFWDTSMTFLVKNQLLSYGKETFVLDETNEIILYGDPLTDKNLYDVFKKLIR